MIELHIDPIVLHRLAASFPKPTNSAVKALAKYKKLLRELIESAVLRGRDPFDVKFNSYTIAVKRLSQEGPCIGPDKERLHSWLTRKNLQLIEFLEVGNNLSGMLSRVKLTPLVKVIDQIDELGVVLRAATSNVQIMDAVDGNKIENDRLFHSLYPDFYKLNTQQRSELYELTPIDVKSLRSYIYWLHTKATSFSPAVKNQFTRQALQILRVALHLNGCYVQRKKPSEFGRMYYEGISVQNVNKTLRRAMLGDCWEYDIRSSAIAFKLGFAEEILNLCEMKDYPRDIFPMSFWYVEGKKNLVTEICMEVFRSEYKKGDEWQANLIKQALTAIGFGAKPADCGWQLKNGAWKNPAIVDILRNQEQRERFLGCLFVKKFTKEQQVFDYFIVNKVKEFYPVVWSSELLSAGVKPSPAKAVAWMYQHFETAAMDAARQILREEGCTVLASIHDAVIVKNQLSLFTREKAEAAMCRATGVDHWHLKGSELNGFGKLDLDDWDDYEFSLTADEITAKLFKAVSELN